MRATEVPAVVDMATALASGGLTSFESRDVTRSKVEIRGVGGGLQEALDVEPVELAHGQEVYVLVLARVDEVRFSVIKESDCVVRVHVLRPVEAGVGFIEARFVAAHLEAQRERIREAHERAQGITRLPLDDTYRHVPGDDEWDNE